MDPVELLLEQITARNAWPPARETRVLDVITQRRAFLESDRDTLRDMAGWPKDRDYKVDPLPELIASAWADHLFGADPTVTPANDTDANPLALVLEGNRDLVGDLHHAEAVTAGEGEAWWRLYVDRDVADVPLLEWHGRDEVLPLYVSGRLMAAALVTELEERRRGDAKSVVYRHMEVHADELVEHVLFRGSKTRIGQTVDLNTHPELEDLAADLGPAQQWRHGLPMLLGKVTNGRRRLKRLPNLGVSDYHGITDDLLDLNEAKSIGAENMRLTAKKRAVVPESALRQRAASPAYTGPLVDRGDGIMTPANDGQFDAGEDLLVMSELDAELGRSATGLFTVLEYSFDAEPLLAWKRDLVESALTRVGLTPQYVGVITGQGDGLALSGTALRLRLIPTTKAGAGKARPWDDTLPHVLSLMARLDNLGVPDGGFGRPWADPTSPPAVERADTLPHDDVEEAQVESTLVGARVRSRRTSIAAQHPDWTDEQVQEELDAIGQDTPATSGFGGSPLA